jgi:hypothetical protein
MDRPTFVWSFERNQVYEVGAALLVLLACPDEKSPSLCWLSRRFLNPHSRPWQFGVWCGVIDEAPPSAGRLVCLRPFFDSAEILLREIEQMVHRGARTGAIAKPDTVHYVLMNRQRPRLVFHEARGEQERSPERCLDGADQTLQDDIVAGGDNASVEGEVRIATGIEAQGNRALHSQIGRLYGGQVRGRSSLRGKFGCSRLDDPTRFDQASHKLRVIRKAGMP